MMHERCYGNRLPAALQAGGFACLCSGRQAAAILFVVRLSSLVFRDALHEHIRQESWRDRASRVAVLGWQRERLPPNRPGSPLVGGPRSAGMCEVKQ